MRSLLAFLALPFNAFCAAAGCITRWGWRDTIKGVASGEIKLSSNGSTAFRKPRN